MKRERSPQQPPRYPIKAATQWLPFLLAFLLLVTTIVADANKLPRPDQPWWWNIH